jgi:hypothetical protein
MALPCAPDGEFTFAFAFLDWILVLTIPKRKTGCGF